MIKLFHFLLVMSFMLLGGCINFSSYQTAKTVKPGEVSFVAGLTMTEVTPSNTDLDVVYEDASYITPEAMVRFGIAERIDLGVKAWLSFPFLGWTFDGKLQLLDSSAVDLAVSLGVSHYGIELGPQDQDVDYTDFIPAALITLKLSPHVSLTISPKYIERNISATNAVDDKHSYSGASFTLMAGDRVRIMPEIGFFEGEGNEFVYYGLGLGFGF